ncbi:hypothetical protein EJ071_38030 [Mesorhizobium sp. M1B.F.Ca.ET.045.04.1.1]|nr:hypothetical protein EJ071_38030 [Mesorhizobium sp. M1B.F.Ca.ET.045.04.1.1]
MAAAARAQLAKFGIGLNSVENGIGLTNHAGRHTNLYSRMVAQELGLAKTKKQVEAVLDRVSKEMSKVDSEISSGARSEKSAADGWAHDVDSGRTKF